VSFRQRPLKTVGAIIGNSVRYAQKWGVPVLVGRQIELAKRSMGYDTISELIK
jgi:hypothetical protein